jgi:glycerol-3-phosphate dehydrogenase
MPDAYDLAIVGGGIHGACIARDAAGRGLSVLLLERGDLGGATSLGLLQAHPRRPAYLEHLDLRLVREALAEREIPAGHRPHLVRPLRFVLPVGPGTRPARMVRFGLALYDRLSCRRTARQPRPSPPRLALRRRPAPGVRARLPSTPTLAPTTRASSRQRPRRRRPRRRDPPAHRLVSATRAPHGWTLVTQPRPAPNGALPLGVPRAPSRCTARALMDAAGPWTAQLLSDVIRVRPQRQLRLVKGSHVVVPRLYEGSHAYILQQPDRRVVFLIPWGATRTLLGTTEVVVDAPGPAHLEPAETDYLCAAVARFLRDAPTPRDVL